jgi:hypothetical protein
VPVKNIVAMQGKGRQKNTFFCLADLYFTKIANIQIPSQKSYCKRAIA